MKRMRQKIMEIKERKMNDMKILNDPTQIKADQSNKHICVIGIA